MSSVIDTNVIVAIIFEDDANHDKAVKLWETLNEAYIPMIAIVELGYFLIKHKINLSIIGRILQDPKIKVVENTLQDIYFTINHKDSIKHYDDFNDLMILSTAIRLGLPLVTFDEELLNLYNRLKTDAQ